MGMSTGKPGSATGQKLPGSGKGIPGGPLGGSIAKGGRIGSGGGKAGELDEFLREKGIRKKIFDRKERLTRMLAADLKPWEREHFHRHLSRGEIEFLMTQGAAHGPRNRSQIGMNGYNNGGVPQQQNNPLRNNPFQNAPSAIEDEDFPEMVGRIFADMTKQVDPLMIIFWGTVAAGMLMIFSIIMAAI